MEGRWVRLLWIQVFVGFSEVEGTGCARAWEFYFGFVGGVLVCVVEG